MAIRQADFATVMCVAERFVNDCVRAAFENMPPPLVRLPTPIVVAGTPVNVDGVLTLRPPVVTLGARADDRMVVNARFTGPVTFSSGSTQTATYDATLDFSVLVGIAIELVSDRYFIGLDTGSATVVPGSLSLSVDRGGLHSNHGNAGRSAAVEQALTLKIRQLPKRLTRLVPQGIPATYQLAPPGMPCGASLFQAPPLFEARLNIDRVEARPVAGALVVGIDFAGTHGDRAALPNLFTQGDVNVLSTTMNVDTDRYDEWNTPRPVDTSRCSIGVSVNPSAITSFVAQVLAPATRYSFLDCHVTLRDLGITFGSYQEDPPLKPQWLPGAELFVAATYYSAPGRDPQTSKLLPGGNEADVQVRATVAMHRKAAYSAIRDDANFASWNVTVQHVDIDLPWWMTFGAVVAGVTTPVLNLMPVVSIPAALFALTSLQENLEALLSQRAQAGINGAARQIELGNVSQKVHLPELPEPLWTVVLNALSMSDQGLELFATYSPQPRPSARPDAALTVVYDGRTIHDGDSLQIPAGGGARYCDVTLDPAVADLNDPALNIHWNIQGGEPGAVDPHLTTGDGPYAQNRRFLVAHDLLAPTGTEGEYRVSIRVYRQSAGNPEFGSCDFHVSANDRFASGAPYVRWEHTVNGYFEPNWHGAQRVSAIHRTDPDGRCAMLDRATHQRYRTQIQPPRYQTPFQFMDYLSFPSQPDFAEYQYKGDTAAYQSRLAELLILDRATLCDYCFFGGPDKNTLRAPIITRPEQLM